jgi:hypothetical protein
LAKCIKNIKVSWDWKGDIFKLQGFKIAVMPKGINPNEYDNPNVVAGNMVVK